jgi:fatty-acyl-CoA synthase
MVDGLEVFSVGESPSSRSFEAALNEQPAELRFERVLSRETVAAYYHTGGTTGAPKLARHTHGNQVHTSWFAGMFYDLGEGDCILNGFPLFHVAGAFVYGSAAFCAGSSILLAPPLGMRDPAFLRHYWRFVDRCRVSHLAAVPTVIGTLLDTPAGEADLSSVKALYTGGSPLPTELANSFERSYSIPVRNILGMTECAGLVSIEPLGAPRTANSCGLRLPFTEVFAVSRAEGNCDPSRTCLPDEPGVIVVRGPHVSPGYTNPQLNAGMFEADGLLLSGDIGHVDALGRVFITGRAKDVIIRGAHNIDPNMIEEVFSAHADVQSCAAVGAPDRHSGEVPVIFLALRPNATSSPADILSFAASRISEPAALPKRVTILPALPTTAIGKIYRPALRILAIEQVFSEALALLDPAESGTSFRVKAMETPSGLRAEIGIPRALDPRPAQEKVIEALGRFAIPLDWISI